MDAQQDGVVIKQWHGVPHSIYLDPGSVAGVTLFFYVVHFVIPGLTRDPGII
jgi:hypothetical protein